MTSSDDEKRSQHFRNIRDLGQRADESWAEYRESELMKVRCDLLHWQARRSSLEIEAQYAAEVVARKEYVVKQLEARYSEANRGSEALPIHGCRESLQAGKLAADDQDEISGTR